MTNSSGPQYSYVYDLYGNRWQQNALQGGYSLSESFDAATNQTTAASGYTYDAAGNMIYDGIHHYSYDAEGKVLTVDTTGAQFSYGAFDERVRVIQGSADTVILHNPFGNRVTEGNVTLGFTSEGISYWGTRPVAYYTASPAETQFEHQDYLGTERMRTSYNGAVEGTFTSLPFGDGFAVASGTDTDVYHFAGLEDDSSDNTSHAQFRNYSQTQGRWLAPDPYDGSYDFSNPQSFNRYAYVNNNPLTFTDPSGQNACGGSEGADGGFNFSPLGAIICGIKTLDQIIGRSHFNGTLTPRPAGTPDWGDDPGSFGESLGIPSGIKLGSGGIAGVLGLPDAGCEFGACDIGAISSFGPGGSSGGSNPLEVTSGAVSGGFILPLFFGVLGPAGSFSYDPKNHLVCYGGGIGLSAGHTVGGGPVVVHAKPGNTSEDVLSGWSVSGGYNWTPWWGYQGSKGSSGYTAGYSFGVPGASGAVTYSSCKHIGG